MSEFTSPEEYYRDLYFINRKLARLDEYLTTFKDRVRTLERQLEEQVHRIDGNLNSEVKLLDRVNADHAELFVEIFRRLERLEARLQPTCATADDCSQPFLGNCHDCPLKHLVATDEDGDA